MSERRATRTDRAPAAGGPYSQAVTYGQLVFVAGQLGTDPASGQFVGDGVEAQAEQAMKNLAAVLDAAGSSLDEVVKTTIFLADIDDFGTVNEVYARHMREPYPARSTVQVAALPRNARVEIECIAAAGATS